MKAPAPMPVGPDGRSEPSATAVIRVRVSHYNPALGGVNCFSFVNGKCVSRMANGQRWQQWMGRAAACVPEWPFGTVVVVGGRAWICKDRGGKVKTVRGIPWIDMLSEVALYPYGTVVDAVVRYP